MYRRREFAEFYLGIAASCSEIPADAPTCSGRDTRRSSRWETGRLPSKSPNCPTSGGINGVHTQTSPTVVIGKTWRENREKNYSEFTDSADSVDFRENSFNKNCY